MLAIARVLACAHLGPNIHLQRAKQRRRFRPKAAELRRHILQANRGHIARGLAARALAGRDADFLVAAQGCLREIARLQGPAVAALRPGVEEAPALEVPGPLCQGRRRQAGRVVALLAPRRRLGRLAHLLASGGSVGQDLLPELQLGSGAGWGPDGATLRQSGGPAALHFQQVHVRRRPLAASGRSASRPFAGGGPKLRQHRLMQIPWHSPLQGQVSGSRRHLPQAPGHLGRPACFRTKRGHGIRAAEDAGCGAGAQLGAPAPGGKATDSAVEATAIRNRAQFLPDVVVVLHRDVLKGNLPDELVLHGTQPPDDVPTRCRGPQRGI